MGLSAEEIGELLKHPNEGKVPYNRGAAYNEDGTKTCPRCNVGQPITEYTKDKNRRDGLKVYCKTCCKKEREENRDYYAEKSKEWREAHPERFKEKRDAWMQAHPQSENPTRQEWMRKNVAKVRQIKKTYKVRRMGWEVGEVDYLEVLMRDGFVCHICGNDVEPDDVHFDHVIPLSKGGQHSTDNIHVAHSRCNIRKSNKILEDEQAIQRLLDRIRVEEAG